MRERGLKHTWIDNTSRPKYVAPHAGAWIETFRMLGSPRNRLSLPMRERGLKRTTII